MRRLAEFYRTVRDRCEEFVLILAYALDDGPIERVDTVTIELITRSPYGEDAVERTVHELWQHSEPHRLVLPLSGDDELRALVALFPRCTECGGNVETNDWNARLSPRRKNRVAHVACPFSPEVPDDGEW